MVAARTMGASLAIVVVVATWAFIACYHVHVAAAVQIHLVPHSHQDAGYRYDD